MKVYFLTQICDRKLVDFNRFNEKRYKSGRYYSLLPENLTRSIYNSAVLQKKKKGT